MRKFFSWIDKAEKAICGTGFLLLIALVFLSAFLRFFRVSMSWNIDMAMLLLAWTAFLGADIAWRSGQIIGVNLLTRNLPARLQLVIEVLVYIIILAALVMMCVYTLRLAWVDRIARYQSIPIPYSLVTLSLAVATFSMIFSTLWKIWGVLRKFSPEGEPTGVDQ